MKTGEKIDLKRVAQEGRETVEMFHDKKAWAGEKEMKAMLEAGAQVVQSQRQIGGDFVIEVIFDGIHFVHTNKVPLAAPRKGYE